MATANLLVVVSAYSGTNAIQISVRKQSDPNADVVPAQYANGAFTGYSFFFSPLQRGEFYQVYKFEVDKTTHAVLQAYPPSVAFPINNYESRYKEPVEWTAGVTNMPNGNVFPANTNTIQNDDWKGWAAEGFTDFNSEYSKQRYSFDPNTGTLTLTEVGNVFTYGAEYKFRFQPQDMLANNQPSSSSGGSGFTEKVVVTDDSLKDNNGNYTGIYNLALTDIGKLILLKATALYYTIQMPALAGAVELKRTRFEMEPSNNIAYGNHTNS